MYRKLIFGLIVLVVGAGIAGFTYLRKDMGAGDKKPLTQSHPTYSLNLLSGYNYAVDKPQVISLVIEDQTKKVLKEFDSSQDQVLHLVAISKARTDFQHLHPKLDQASGTFKQQITFTLNGDYRLFATFSASSVPVRQDETKLNTTVYKDFQVGDISGYEPPQTLDINKSAAVSKGFIASFFFPPNDDSIGPTNTNFYAGHESSVLITVDKEGQSVKNLESYHGSLGRLTVIGPELELLVVNAIATDANNQTGLLTFPITFPKGGFYKLYLETQAEGQLATFNFALNVKDATPTIQPNKPN